MTLAARIIAHAKKRKPDFQIGGKKRPYIDRWYVIPRNPLFNTYIHHMQRDDDDRALHDHPWWNLSIILSGGYFEHMPDRVEWRGVGQWVLRRASAAHRLALKDHVNSWSLFITGPRIREWGFWCKHGWVHWKDFTDPSDSGAIGPGCGEE